MTTIRDGRMEDGGKFLPEKLSFEAFNRYDDSGNGNFTSVPHRTHVEL